MVSRTIGSAEIAEHLVLEPGETWASQTEKNTLRYARELRDHGVIPDFYYNNPYFPQPERSLPDDDPSQHTQMRTIRRLGGWLDAN